MLLYSNMAESTPSAPKYMRKEEEKKRRMINEKLKRLSNRVKEFMLLEPEVPLLFLYSVDGKTSGQVSPWLQDFAKKSAEGMSNISMEHYADVLLSGKEIQSEKINARNWEELLNTNIQEISESNLRKIMPVVVRGITGCVGKKLWSSENCAPEGWPEDVPFQDPNKTVNNHKLSAEEIRRVMGSLQTAHSHGLEPADSEKESKKGTHIPSFNEKHTVSTYKVQYLMDKGKYAEIRKMLETSSFRDAICHIILNHNSTLALQEGFRQTKKFSLGLLRKSVIPYVNNGLVPLYMCTSLAECLSIQSLTNADQLELLTRSHGQIHIEHYIYQYEKIVKTDEDLSEVCNHLNIKKEKDLTTSLHFALSNGLHGKFELLMLAGAIRMNVLFINPDGREDLLPPCPCEQVCKSLVIKKNADTDFSLLVKKSSLEGHYGFEKAEQEASADSKIRLPGMEVKLYKIEMGIDLYADDVASLIPNIWLTDAIVDVAAKRLTSQRESNKVFVFDTTFAQRLLVKGRLDKRPLDLTACNYLAVKHISPDLKDGIFLWPISNMVHWFLVAFTESSISVMCSMGGTYECELASIKIFINKELERSGASPREIKIVYKEVPRQRNSSDCGVYLISFMKNIVENQSLDDVDKAIVLTRGELRVLLNLL